MDKQDVKLRATAALANLTAAQLRLRTTFEYCAGIEGLGSIEGIFCEFGGWTLLQRVSDEISEKLEALSSEALSQEKFECEDDIPY